MNLTWQDIREIVDIYEHINEDYEGSVREWMMDDDQTGIPYPYTMTKEDIYKMTLSAFNKQKSE